MGIHNEMEGLKLDDAAAMAKTVLYALCRPTSKRMVARARLRPHR